MLSYSADQLNEWQTVVVPHYARQLLRYNEIKEWPPNFTHCENKYGMCAFIEVCSSTRSMRDEVVELNFVNGKGWDIQND